MICHDPPAPITEELNFDKFMDEILVKEIKEAGSKEEVIEENRVKVMNARIADRASNRIKYKK